MNGELRASWPVGRTVARSVVYVRLHNSTQTWNLCASCASEIVVGRSLRGIPSGPTGCGATPPAITVGENPRVERLSARTYAFRLHRPYSGLSSGVVGLSALVPVSSCVRRRRACCIAEAMVVSVSDWCCGVVVVCLAVEVRVVVAWVSGECGGLQSILCTVFSCAYLSVRD